jgi:hypothetical protein
LFLFNPDRVLTDIPKPPAEATVLDADGVRSCSQDVVPRTPMTPVSAEALAALQILIKQDAQAFDETSKQSLQRHVEKLTNAAHRSFAKTALLEDRDEFLTTINNEAKVRRSTRPVVLGTAKGMSYKDLEKARADYIAKDEAKAKGKGRRGRKRKSSAPAEEATTAKGKRGRERKNPESEAETPEPATAKAARTSEEHDLPRAPVALMTEAQDPVQDPAGDPVAWTSEVQEHANNLMAWMARNAKSRPRPQWRRWARLMRLSYEGWKVRFLEALDLLLYDGKLVYCTPSHVWDNGCLG